MPDLTCQCVVRYQELKREIREMKEEGIWAKISPGGQETLLAEADSQCTADADPESGEAMLCDFCWEQHREDNMVLKRLPKRMSDLVT